MGDLLIRNISDAMKRSLSLRAEQAGHSLSDEAKQILQKGLIDPGNAPRAAGRSAWDVLRPILVADSQEEAEEYAAIMDEIEAERKKDFGRLVEDLE